MDKDSFIQSLRDHGLTDSDLEGAIPADFLQRHNDKLLAFDKILFELIDTRSVKDFEMFLRVCILLSRTAPMRYRVEQEAARQAAREGDTEAFWRDHWRGGDGDA